MKKTGYNVLFTIIVLHNTEMDRERESRKDRWEGRGGRKEKKRERRSRETSMGDYFPS